MKAVAEFKRWDFSVTIQIDGHPWKNCRVEWERCESHHHECPTKRKVIFNSPELQIPRELTQTPNFSNDSNTWWAFTSMIRNDSCAPRCSGSSGVRILTLTLLDESKQPYTSTKLKSPVIHPYGWLRFQLNHTDIGSVIWISFSDFRCQLHQTPSQIDVIFREETILALTSKLAAKVAHWWMDGLLIRNPSAPTARSISTKNPPLFCVPIVKRRVFATLPGLISKRVSARLPHHPSRWGYSWWNWLEWTKIPPTDPALAFKYL